MWKTAFSVGTFLLSAGLFFSSCNSNSTMEQPTVASSPVKHEVEIRDMKFEPDVLFAKTGDTVVFTNDDLVTHDVTEQNKAWTSSALAPGKSWSMVITGSVAYYCSIHVVMKGKIIVK